MFKFKLHHNFVPKLILKIDKNKEFCKATCPKKKLGLIFYTDTLALNTRQISLFLTFLSNVFQTEHFFHK